MKPNICDECGKNITNEKALLDGGYASQQFGEDPQWHLSITVFQTVSGAEERKVDLCLGCLCKIINL